MSKDAGVSWTPVLEDGPPKGLGAVSEVSDIAFYFADPPNIYANMGGQIWKATDATDPREWSVMGAADVTGGGEMAFQPGNPKVMAILTGTRLSGTLDRGHSWVPLHQAGYEIGNVVYQGLPPGARSLTITAGFPWTICIGSDTGVWCHKLD